MPPNKQCFGSRAEQLLQVCLGLPKDSCASGAIPEAGCLPIDVVASQETMRTHLRRVLKGKKHFLHPVHLTHSNSGFDQAVQVLHLVIINQSQKLQAPTFPPWALSPLKVKQFIQGVNGKEPYATGSATASCSHLLSRELYLGHPHLHQWLTFSRDFPLWSLKCFPVHNSRRHPPRQ